MRPFRPAAIAITLTAAVAAASPGFTEEAVHTYTSDELDRKFGRIPSVSQPVDRSRIEDWLSVQEFLDREYARIDADRRYDMERRAAGPAAENREPRGCSRVVVWAYGSSGPRWRWNSHGTRPSHRGPHMKRAGFPRP